MEVDHLVSEEGGSDSGAVSNGDPLATSPERCSEEVTTVPTTMNGQLEIEIPAGEARQGAIHTIQLQSPGGNTHIVEGLVVTSTGAGGGEIIDGETLFHPAQAGAFLLPTSSSQTHNNLTSTFTSSTSPSTCEVITAESADHHILSGLQVVRVTTGENGETIFLVPSTATGDKDGMQQVMVLQSAEEIQEEHSQVPAEMVEESVEINIPSPKPILTTVKQEVDISNSGSSSDALQYQPTTTLVVVTGNNGGAGESIDQKPVLTTVNGPTATTTVTSGTPSGRGATATATVTPTTPNGGIKSDDRPKRKAALKAVATRKAALASASPRKQNSGTPRTAKPKGKVTEMTTAPVSLPKATLVSSSSSAATTTTTFNSNSKGRETCTIVGTTSLLPVGISTVPQISTPSTSRVLLPGGTSIQATPRSYFLLPEDVVSESDDEGDGTVQRKCVVCLRKRRFTEDIFEGNSDGNHVQGKQQLLQHMDVLISHLNIPVKKIKRLNFLFLFLNGVTCN